MISRRIAVYFVSLLALLYQISLLSVFSDLQWSAFVSFVVSLTMLGIGVSGVILSICRDIVTSKLSSVRRLAVIGWGVTSIFVVPVLQSVPLHAQEILWSSDQYIYLVLYFILPSIPFVFSGVFIGSFYLNTPPRAGKVYFFDLLGACSGALLAPFALENFGALNVLMFNSTCSLLVLLLLSISEKGVRPLSFSYVVLFAILNTIFPALDLKVSPSPYKEISKALLRPNSRVIESFHGALGSLYVVNSPAVPFRFAPGLSLAYHGIFPEQLGLFVQGDNFIPINRNASVEFYRHTPESLGYQLSTHQLVVTLVLGESGGVSVDRALKMGSSQVVTTLGDERLLETMGSVARSNSLSHLIDRRVESVVGAPRSFLHRDMRRFDFIDVPFDESILSGSQENYLLTVEGLGSVIDKLNAPGILQVNRLLQYPPRDSLRLFNTAYQALLKRVSDPSQHLIMVRTLHSCSLLVSRVPWSKDQVLKVKELSKKLFFDFVYFPRVAARDSNMYNYVSPNYFFEEVQKIINMEKTDYFFNIEPTTDDKPYFSHFLTLEMFLDLLGQKFKQGVTNISWSYGATWGALLVALVAALTLILVPIITIIRWSKENIRELCAATVYFSLIGFAYLIVEIVVIAKTVKLLGNPIYAVALTIASFLFSSCLGALSSQPIKQFVQREAGISARVFLVIVTIDIIIWGALANYFITPIASFAANYGDLALAFGYFLTVFPLAFMMGMPFPLGIEYLGEKRREIVPYAYAVNGFFSVVSTLAGTLLMLHNGHGTTFFFALCLYGMVGLTSLLLMK